MPKKPAFTILFGGKWSVFGGENGRDFGRRNRPFLPQAAASVLAGLDLRPEAATTLPIARDAQPHKASTCLPVSVIPDAGCVGNGRAATPAQEPNATRGGAAANDAGQAGA